MRLVDKPDDNWSGFCDDSMKMLCYDDGSTKLFTTNDIEITFGKYAGRLLGEVGDSGYLEWLLDKSLKDGDVFQEFYIKMRLKELQ